MTLELSLSEKKSLRSLHLRKYRYKNNAFLIEGVKLVSEAISARYPTEKVYISSGLELNLKRHIISLSKSANIEFKIVDSKEIKKISTLLKPEGVLAVGRINKPSHPLIDTKRLPALYLWQINDPGNLGTVLRTSLWFGIQQVLISPNSVDVYNPKVVRASMGALFRIKIVENIKFCNVYEQTRVNKIKLLGADMSGEPLSDLSLGERWVLAVGSESHGLPEEIKGSTKNLISVKKTGYGESLNLGVSVGIILNELCQKR